MRADRAEQALEEALRRSGVDFSISKGEGAFYGPKIEYSLKDGTRGNAAPCRSTSACPGASRAEYVAEDNTRRTPVMLHRAIVGSFERFIGILIEHYAGAFPLWLAPHQAVVMTITERQDGYALKVKNELLNQGLRVISDLRNEKISYKIREHSLQKLPYQVVVGDKEMQAGKYVAVRTRSGEDLGAMSLERFTARLQAEGKVREHGQFFNGLRSFSHIALERSQRINREITAPEVRLVAENGDQLGIKTDAEALRLAEEQNVDLGDRAAREPAGLQADGLRQVPLPRAEESPRGQAQAEADPGQGNQVPAGHR